MSERPIIVIVGRPNVGKSTLYNNLTGTRDALVSDLPGLTRDRREGEASLAGHKVKLVDTAGLEEARRGSIAERMRAQSEAAIKSADCLIFVIDARAGVTPADEVFARIARQSGKPVILAANKCEGRAADSGFFDAFKMGFGDPLPISAEHGQGIDALESEILAALGLKPVPRRKRRKDDGDEAVVADDAPRTQLPLRVAVVGRPNAGKSTLVNALVGEERMITGPEPGLTRDSIATDIMWGDRPIRLFDTAGLRKKARIDETAEKLSASDAVRAIRFAEVVVLLTDAEHPLEHQDLTIAELAADEGRAIVVAINKWDLVDDKPKALKDIRETIERSLVQCKGISIVTLSALSGRGIDRLRQAILDTYEVWNKRVVTNKLNDWLHEAMQRHAPPASNGRRVKIRYITQPSARPPTFVAFSSLSGGLPKSYVRYLINSLRDTFGLPGVPIRFSLRKSDNPFARD